MINEVSRVGGIFAVLVFWHFVADWTFQTHRVAMAKAKDGSVRLGHCLLYGVAFIPFLVWCGCWGEWQCTAAMAILVGSHYVIDSYVPVILWAKHLRRAPQFADVINPADVRHGPQHVTASEPNSTGTGWRDFSVERVMYASDEDAFRAFASTPIGCILMVVMDQLFHVAFLLPVAWLVTHS